MAIRFYPRFVLAAFFILILACTNQSPSQNLTPEPTTPTPPIDLPSQEQSPAPKEEAVPPDFDHIPIIDMHEHCDPGLTPELMLENMKKANVTQAILIPRGLEYNVALPFAKQYPDNLIAFIGCMGKEWFSQNSGFADVVEDALKTGQYKGLGEFLLRRYADPNHNIPNIYVPADSNKFLRLLSLAEKYSVLTTIHMEAEEKTVRELENTLKRYTRAKIIWAHAGRATVPLVDYMLSTYPNLYIDLAALAPPSPYAAERNPITSEDGLLRDDWIQLLIRFQDKVMTGSDVPGAPSLWAEGIYPKTMNSQRDLLKQLPRDVAEKIAFKNASVLLIE